MEFEKTVELYNKYKTKSFPYEDITSIIREDEELLDDLFLKNKLPATFLFELEFNEKDVYDLNLCTDQTTDLLRLCYLTEMQNCFNNEYKKYIKDDVYFYGCSFSVYKKQYYERLKIFQKKCKDADEIDFVKKEYRSVETTENPYHFLPINFTNEYSENKKYSDKKRKQFLETKIDKLGHEIIYYEEDTSTFYDEKNIMHTECQIIKKNSTNQTKNINSIKWTGTQTELIALIKSLKLSNKLDNSLTEAKTAKIFEEFFNFELKNYSQTKSKFRDRTKDLTPFIDKLKFNLESWIKEKDKKD